MKIYFSGLKLKKKKKENIKANLQIIFPLLCAFDVARGCIDGQDVEAEDAGQHVAEVALAAAEVNKGIRVLRDT